MALNRNLKTTIYQRHSHPTCPPPADGKRPAHRCRGRWVAVIDYGASRGKTRDRRSFYGQTKAEAQAKLNEAMADEVDAPVERSGKVLTVGSWVDEWFTHYKPKLKPQTRESHGSKIRTYIKPLLGNIRLDRLTTLQVEQVESRLTMACPSPTVEGKCPHKPHHGLSVSTARQTFIILKDALGDAVKAGHLRRNPAELADAPATKQAQRPHMKTAIADLTIKAASKKSALEGARACIALEQGLRPGEALGLVWGLLDLDDECSLTVARTIEISGRWGTPKSDAAYRTIPLTTRTLAALRRLRAELTQAGTPPAPTDRVFDRSHDLDQKAWRNLLADNGIPHVTRASARQSAARRLEENGAKERAAAQFLGHSNVNMTFRYQRGADVETLRKSIGA